MNQERCRDGLLQKKLKKNCIFFIFLVTLLLLGGLFYRLQEQQQSPQFLQKYAAAHTAFSGFLHPPLLFCEGLISFIRPSFFIYFPL